MVLEALKRIGKWEDLPEPTLNGSPLEFRYRNRMTFTLLRRGVDGGTVVAGLHEIEHPERVLDTDGRCLLPEEPISRVWDQLRSEWGPGAVRLPLGPELRLTLRATISGKVLLAIEGGKGAGEPEELLKRIPDLGAIWKTYGGTGRSPKLLAGETRTQDLWEGEAVELMPSAFLQVNRRGAEPLREAVVAEVLGLGEGGRVLDAYCGAGIYGREIARAGRECIGIELDSGAVRVARDGAPAGFRVISGRVEDRLPEALPVDVAVLNPPRTGVEQGVMEALTAAGVERMVYVSCDPATLARDTALLGGAFRVSSFQIFDLFPQTAHVETVLTLDRVGL
jgi:23S rRNA (uracil1939-C5)-methyltransferase